MQYVFAGSWDKTITRLTFGPDPSVKGDVTQQQNFTAHSDFVKCLLVARTSAQEAVLISGGADGDVNVWSFTGERLASIKPQCRGIEDLKLDPYSNPDAPVVVFSTSQREIFSFVLADIKSMRAGGLKLSNPIIQHETGVYKLAFDHEGDLWTASADKTAKRLVRENGYVADTTLVHPDFVRDVALHESSGMVITACRDEEIRLWNSGTSELIHVFTGHFEEVTGLAISGSMLLSISIDATLRRWSLRPADIQKAVEEARNPNLLEQEPEPKMNLGMLTAEEEAELKALMENEEEDTLEKMAMDEQ